MPEMDNNTTVPPNSIVVSSSCCSNTVSSTILLILRLLTSVFLLLAFVLLTLTKELVGEVALKFKDFYGFRYMFSTIVIGSAYNNMQLTRAIYTAVTGNRILSGDGGYIIDFLGDKIASYVLLSGCAAGFGLSVDVHIIYTAQLVPLDSFFGKANASASFLLIGFVFTAIASIFTSWALPKKA